MTALLSPLFVIWRETFEALLVLLMIRTIFRKQGVWAAALPFVAGGVAGGVFLSGAFAGLVLFAGEWLEGRSLQLIQAAFPLIAAGLMLHMVAWMSRHAGEIKGEIQALAVSGRRWTFTWGAAALITYALAREGFETVVFLYGLSFNPEYAAWGWGHYAGLLVAGLALSTISIQLFMSGLAFFSMKTFFRVTNVLLLGTAAGLLVSGVNQLIELEILPSIIDPVWNTSSFVSTEGPIGQALHLLFGYNPAPSLTLLTCYLAFWSFAVALLWPRRPQLAKN